MVLANIPTYESCQPMEDRLAAGDDGIEMRLGTLPTVHGIRAVVRLFAVSDNLTTIAQLGLPDDVTDIPTELSESRDGAILMTGPAGS